MTKSYDTDRIAGRGLLGIAYRLPPTRAREAVDNIRLEGLEERHVGGLTLRVVCRPKRQSTGLRTVDNIAFVIWGYLFWSFWDEQGNVYVTKSLAQRLGWNEVDDRALTDIVLADGPAWCCHDRFLRQAWLYWKTKRDLMQGRELTTTEKHLKSLFDRLAIPFAEGLANILAILEEISEDPAEVFRLAWRAYYDFPDAQVDDVSHLSLAEVERLTALRKQKMRGAAILDQHSTKQHLIHEWLRCYRQDDFSRLEGLTDNPRDEAQMLYSFMAVLGIPLMDRLASAFYDEAMDKRVRPEEPLEARAMVSGLRLEEPFRLLRDMLQAKRGVLGKTLILGLDLSWYQDATIRHLLQRLLREGVVGCMLISSILEDQVLLYPEFPKEQTMFVTSRNPAIGRIQFSDVEAVLDVARPRLKEQQNVLVITPTESGVKSGVHCGSTQSIYARLLQQVYGADPEMIYAAVFMDAGFGKQGYFLRSRTNILMHGMIQPGIHGISIAEHKDLARAAALPGNHFRPEVTFGELWDAVIFRGPREDRDGDRSPTASPSADRDLDSRPSWAVERPVSAGAFQFQPTR